MLMQILLDLIYKKLNNLIKIALFLGLSLIFVSCDTNDFSIDDIDYNVKNYFSFSIDKSTNNLNLSYNYPKLTIGVKPNNTNSKVIKIQLNDSKNSLTWDINPTVYEHNNIQYLGSKNINLCSYNYFDGEYNLSIMNDKGKQINTKINLFNNFDTLYSIYLYKYDNRIVFSNKKNRNYSDFQLNKNINTKSKINISYYNYNNEKAYEESISNYFEIENYPFFININNSDSIKNIVLEFKDINNIDNEILIDLSSSNGSF